MGTFPSAALSIKPPENPLDQYAKALSVKSMIGGEQLQQQEIEKNRLAMNDQKSMTAAMQEWDGKSYDDLLPLVKKHGGSANAVIGLKNQVLAQQEKKSTIAKNDAETGAKQLDTLSKKNDMLLGHLNAATGVDDDKLVDAVHTEKNAALSGGYLDQNHADMLEQLLATNDPKKIRPALDIFEKGLRGEKEQFDQALKERDAQSKEWKEFSNMGVLVNTRDGRVREIGTGLQMTPGMMEAKYVGIQSKKAQGQQLAPEEKAFATGYEKMKELVPAFNINMGLTGGGAGPGAGSTATGIESVPPNLQGSVKAVLDYRSPMPPQSRSNPINTATRQWVQKLDPTYDETTFPQRNKILSEYVKSAGEGQIGAINTALGHLNELNDAAKALSRNDIPLLHSIASKVGAAFGSDAATTYQMILHRVGPEMTSAYVKGGGGEGERGANTADFDIQKGAKQIQSNIGESANLLNSKLASQRNNWEKTFKPSKPGDHFDERFITPDAKQILDTLSAARGGAGGKFSVAVPGGRTFHFSSQADADAFKKKAGIE